MLSLISVSRRFGGLWAVRDLSLTVRPGAVVALVGANGSGKTTVLNVASGFLPPHSGEVRLSGRSLTGLRPHEIARAGIARTFQENRIIDQLTARENILLASSFADGRGLVTSLMGRRLPSHASAHRANQLLEMLGLGKMEKQLAGHLSYGQQKLLAIACCLAMQPKVVLLDEPAAGLQPNAVRRVGLIVRSIVSSGEVGILLVEHSIGFVSEFCDRVAIMNAGRKVQEEDAGAFSQRTDLRDLYL